MNIIRDVRGIEILPTDAVTVTSYGSGARVDDCGIVRPVIRFTRTRVVIEDRDGFERAVAGGNLMVRRRDGFDGHEANRFA